jgi:hypothetical protein
VKLNLLHIKKKVMKKIIPILLVVFLFTSCSIHRQITKDTKSHDPEINAASFGMVIKPIVADLKVEATKQSVTYIADLKLPLNELKNNAMELFLTTHKCDYVVDPIFSRVTSVENSRLSDIKITITGFPATYSKVYQVDSLPKSVVQYSSISLPVKRVDYTNSINVETKGKSFGMEFFTKGSSLIGAQVDYAKNVNGLHYYLSIENYGNLNDVSFDWDYKKNPTTLKSETISALNQQVNLSIGIFKEKIFSNKFKLRGFGGLNYSSIKFTTPLSIIPKSNSYIDFTGSKSFGVRFGAALDYRLFNGISIIGRLHANVNMLNFISKNLKNIERPTIENIQFSEKYLLNPCIGIRFNF